MHSAILSLQSNAFYRVKGQSLTPTIKNRNRHSLRISKCVAQLKLETPTEIKEYIQQGPLLEACGASKESIESEIQEWLRIGEKFCSQLGFAKDNLDERERIRVYHYYLPVYMWLLKELAMFKQEQGGEKAPTMVVGMSAPQGCGKSTLVEQLELLLESEGLRTVVVSLDDFYLTHDDQIKLANDYQGNPLLEFRGNAGTHDLSLCASTFSKIKQSGLEKNFSMKIPRYNKAAFSGRGDQKPQSEWPEVTGKVDIVLYEGWMLGFRPQPEEAVKAVDPNLVVINDMLKQYVEFMDQYLDVWLVIKISDPKMVYDWRLQAEKQMKAGGIPGMTDEEVADFVSRFIPAYDAYLPDLYQNGPTTAKPGKLFVVEVDQKREPIANQPKPIM